MRTRLVLVLVLVLASAVGVGAWFASRRSEAPPVAAPARAPPAPMGCAFSAGDRAAFRLESSAAAGGAGADAPRDRFGAVLSWEVVSQPSPNVWLVRAGFSSVVIDQRLSQPEQRVGQPLDAAFFVRVGRDCRFAGQGYPPDWAPTTRRFVSSMLSSLEFGVVAPGPRYELEQSDGMGRYLAKYEATVREDGAVELVKAKTSYRQDQRGGVLGVQVQLVSARATATLARSGRWLDRAAGFEHARITMKDTVLADLELRYALERDDAAFVRPGEAADGGAIDWQDPFVMPTQIAAAVDPELVALTLDGALKRFAALYLKTAKGDAYAAALFLSAWLKAHPDEAGTLVAQVRAGGIVEAMRPAVFLALELAGTPQARLARSAALEDPKMPELDRARAASALSDVPEPTREAGRALVEASRNPDSTLVAGTSVRALGHLVERLETGDAELKRELQDALRGELQSAKNDSRAIDVVDAIGNTGDEGFASELSLRLAATSPSMREHAARAFRKMESTAAAPSLLERLRVESDPAVRVAIVETLLALGVRDPDAMALATTLVATEGTPAVRAVLIRWLGAAADLPVARAGLVAQFHREQVPQLLQLIGRYVSADELK